MSTDKQNNAPLSAEPVIFVTGYRRYDDFELGPICTTLELAEKAVDAWAAQEGYRKECLFIDEQKLLSEPKTAPVAAQPDVTQQTLDDVKAGIPARDAEIAALRKEIEALQAQQDTDKVDAERYQAWRDALITGKTAEDYFIRLVADSLPTSVGVSRRPTAAEWDAAIDAARKEQA